MELIAELVNNQFMSYVPVALVLVALTLLFTFGFKPSEQPSFDQLSVVGDDRKAGAKKQRKVKDKKTAANGSAVSVSETKNEKSKEAKQSPTKETPNTPKQTKKPEADKKKGGGEVKVKKVDPVEVKNKKNVAAAKVEKPADFDDGNWETVPSKNDKKKKQDSPKKEKKAKVNKEEDNNKENKVENVVAKKEDKVKESPPEPEKMEELPEEKEVLGPVFDELGDAWAEAKQPRKSKKKSRRDN